MKEFLCNILNKSKVGARNLKVFSFDLKGTAIKTLGNYCEPRRAKKKSGEVLVLQCYLES